MKPFDLKLAKQGKPVCTRDGRSARVICWDRKYKIPNAFCILALIVNDGDETIASYTNEGRLISEEETACDLMMVTKKHEGWINIKRIDGDNDPVPYAEGVFVTEQQAKDVARIGSSCENHIATLKIEWEE